MTERSFYALEYRQLNALRWQSEKDGGALCFKITEDGLMPVEDGEDCDVAIGRSAVYLYSSLPVTRKLRHQTASHPQSNEHEDKFANEAFRLLFQIEEFEALNDDELFELSQKAIRHHYLPGSMVLRQHEQGDSLFVVAEGIFDIFMEADCNENVTVFLREMTPGYCFGEMSLLTGEPRSASIRAKTDCVAYEIKKAHLADIMARNPQIVQVLSELMAVRQLASNQQAFFNRLNHAVEMEEEQSVARSFSEKILAFFGLSESSD